MMAQPYDDPEAVASMSAAIIAEDMDEGRSFNPTEASRKDSTMSALAKQEEAQTAVVVSVEAASILEVISRAAADPSTDVDKLERLLGMYERITERSAKTAYSQALAIMQPQLPVVTEKGRIEVPAKDGKTGHSTPFAKWEDINDAIRPVLADHGFALSFRVGTAADGKLTITGILSHREGHQEETTITLMHDSSGSKNPVQAVGSSTSYGKRYTAMALLNITTRGEDDDGKKGGDPASITPDQVGELQELMESVSADKPKFLAFFKVQKLADLPAAKFDQAIALLKAKAGAK